MRYIIQLGSPNSPEGELSPIAISRTQKTAELALVDSTARVLITGGWGEHFNQAPLAHGYYVREMLINIYRIAADRIGDLLMSSNTVEDAVLVKRIVGRDDELFVVTSDFHAARAEYVFRCVLGAGIKLEIVQARENGLGLKEEDCVHKHEDRALAKLQSQGGVIWENKLYPSP